MKRRDFLKATAAATLAAAASACVPQTGAASAAPTSGGAASASSAKDAAPSAAAPAGSVRANGGYTVELAALPHYTGDESAPAVYCTPEISADALTRAYEALGWTPSGRLAVKLSTGEPPASNYLRAELIAPLIRQLGGAIVECNTAYGGPRSSTAAHCRVAEEHGFTAIADVRIQDENGSMTLPAEGGAVWKWYGDTVSNGPGRSGRSSSWSGGGQVCGLCRGEQRLRPRGAGRRALPDRTSSGWARREPVSHRPDRPAGL